MNSTTETAASPVQAQGGSAAHPHRIPIEVNFRPVVMPTRETTGIEIKRTAIAQEVPIQIDFVLFQDFGKGRRELLRDDQVVELEPHNKFEAVPGDDNS